MVEKQARDARSRLNLAFYKKISLVAIIITNFLLGGTLSWKLYTKQQYQGGLEILNARMNQTVLIYRDGDGVPIIEARTLDDLFFAQGYVEAKDRLFQCDMLRKVATGSLSSILGADQLESDFFIHAIGIPVIANASISRTRPEILHLCQRYVDGLNWYIENRLEALPMEYDLLKLTGLPLSYMPDKFTVQDVMAVLLYFGFQFTGNHGLNILMARLVHGMGFDGFNAITGFLKVDGEYEINESHASYLHFLGEHSSSSITSESLNLPRVLKPMIDPIAGKNRGSNCWAVAGSRTSTGGTMLASDPHLAIGNPGIMKSWYLSCVNEGMTLIGAQFPLIPGIIVGRNDDISWGITAPFYDCGDTWFESIDATGSYYLYDGSYHPILEEEIHMKLPGGKMHAKTVKKIPGHGVLLDIFGYQVSYRWTAMIDTRPDNNGSCMLNGLFDLLMASEISDITSAMDPGNGWDDFPLCLLIATKNGNIGYLGTGRIPIRKNEEVQGVIPLNGSDPGDDWIRWNHQEEIPRCVNPASGIVYAANTKPDFPMDNVELPYLAPAHGNAYRANRIRDLLNHGGNISLEAMNSMQGDLLDYWAPLLVPELTDVLSNHVIGNDFLEKCLNHLVEWNYLYEADSIGSVVYQAFLERYGIAILGDELGISQENVGTDEFTATCQYMLHPELLLNITLEASHSPILQALFDNRDTPSCETVDDIILSTYQDAMTHVATILGNDPGTWKWSSWNPLILKHLLYQGQGFLEFLNLGPYNVDGGMCIKMQRNGEGAATRFLMAWGDTVKTSLVSPPGPVGSHFSPLEDSEMDAYLQNQVKLFPSDINETHENVAISISTILEGEHE
ncbi:hypothetical protein GF325_14860 [Candidatus Bathyarchaeota archaeon]|nr:hypothetical protein [Candidatus Bathyarchaeota archaeon]